MTQITPKPFVAPDISTPDFFEEDQLTQPMCVVNRLLENKPEELLKMAQTAKFLMRIEKGHEPEISIIADLPIVQNFIQPLLNCGNPKGKENPNLSPPFQKKEGETFAFEAPKRPRGIQGDGHLVVDVEGFIESDGTYLRIAGMYYIGHPFDPSSFAHLSLWHWQLQEEQMLGATTQLYLQNNDFRMALSGETSWWQRQPEQLLDAGFSILFETKELDFSFGGTCKLGGHLPNSPTENGCRGTINITPSSTSTLFVRAL